MSRWLGECLFRELGAFIAKTSEFDPDKSWPKTGFGCYKEGPYQALVSTWPVQVPRPPLTDFLQYETSPLSYRAVSGFLDRLLKSSLRYPDEFREALEAHKERMSAPSNGDGHG